MADKEKIKKKKVKKEVDEPVTPEPEHAAPTRSSLHHSTKSSKKAVKRSGSNVFSMFSTQQVAEFKEVLQTEIYCRCSELEDIPFAYQVTLQGERFLLYDSRNEDIEGRVLVFATQKNLELLCRSSNWFLDGTFKGFALMDRDKDGILGKEDLRGTWDAVGKLVSDKDLDEMLHEAPGPVNFTQLLSLFANRMAGGADDDSTIREAFMTFDENGRIDTNKLKHALVTWGDKFSAKEVADALECMGADGRGYVSTDEVVQMLTAGGDEELSRMSVFEMMGSFISAYKDGHYGPKLIRGIDEELKQFSQL